MGFVRGSLWKSSLNFPSMYVRPAESRWQRVWWHPVSETMQDYFVSCLLLHALICSSFANDVGLSLLHECQKRAISRCSSSSTDIATMLFIDNGIENEAYSIMSWILDCALHRVWTLNRDVAHGCQCSLHHQCHRTPWQRCTRHQLALVPCTDYEWALCLQSCATIKCKTHSMPRAVRGCHSQQVNVQYQI